MKLTFPNAKFTSQEVRQRLATRLARIIASSYGIDFEPYKVVPSDSMAWVLDQHNDWRLTFSIDDDTTAEIRCRYQGPGADHEGALAAWICHVLGATVAQQSLPGAVAELSDDQIMASIGRWAGQADTSVSDSRPLGQQWGQICSLFRHVARERYGAAPQPVQQAVADPYDHGPQVKTIDEALRDVSKWLNERPNRPLDLRHVAMLCHALSAPQPAQQPQLLTDAEVTECRTHNMLRMSDSVLNEFSRAIEQAVLKKNGFAPQPAQQVEPVVGWKLVPIEPTPAMVDAGTDGGDINEPRLRAVYKAMLEEASKPSAAGSNRASAITGCIDRLIFGGQPAAAQMLRHHFAKDLGEE